MPYITTFAAFFRSGVATVIVPVNCDPRPNARLSNTHHISGRLAYLELTKSSERHTFRRLPPRCKLSRRRPLTRLQFLRLQSRAYVETTNTILSASGSDPQRFSDGKQNASKCKLIGFLATPCKRFWRRRALKQFKFKRKQLEPRPTTRQTPRRP